MLGSCISFNTPMLFVSAHMLVPKAVRGSRKYKQSVLMIDIPRLTGHLFDRLYLLFLLGIQNSNALNINNNDMNVISLNESVDQMLIEKSIFYL